MDTSCASNVKDEHCQDMSHISQVDFADVTKHEIASLDDSWYF